MLCLTHSPGESYTSRGREGTEKGRGPRACLDRDLACETWRAGLSSGCILEPPLRCGEVCMYVSE